MNSMRLFAIIAAAFLVGALPAPAQSNHPVAPTIQDRSYKLLSEDEDWSFLTDTDLRQDLWDPIKYVRFRNDSNDWYLTIGGEGREVWEQIGNDNWVNRHSGTVISMKDTWFTLISTMANTFAPSSS
jgi:hypothetical protein